MTSVSWYIMCNILNYITMIKALNQRRNISDNVKGKIIKCIYTGYKQKNGAVTKVNKKFISHLTRAQRTQSAAATLQVSRALPAVRFSCLLRGRGASFQDGVAAIKGFLCAPF